jgi:protein tyrosine/serine phosphatase
LKEIIKILTEEHNFINLFWFNFHKVDEGVYRSAQLTPWRLKKIIKKYNIKTIINLRGNKQNYLYKREKEICEKMGVEYYTISLKSRDITKIRKEELEKLINIFKSAKKPLLFHCKAGADRTGFAAVLWHLINGKDKNWAIDKELRLKYAYLSFSKAGILKELFKKYDEKEDFIEWFEKNKHKIHYKGNKLINFLYEKILKRE